MSVVSEPNLNSIALTPKNKNNNEENFAKEETNNNRSVKQFKHSVSFNVPKKQSLVVNQRRIKNSVQRSRTHTATSTNSTANSTSVATAVLSPSNYHGLRDIIQNIENSTHSMNEAGYQSVRKFAAASVSYNETVRMVPDDRKKNSRKLKIVLLFVIIYFFAEIIAGYKYNCLALVADAFHMLTDAISLVIALYGIKVAEKDASENWGNMTSTFGWGRAEVIATLLNAVFLMVVCMKLGIEAIERMIDPEAIVMPKVVFIVATGGLIINILGLILLNGDHGHSHGGGSHSHSHGGGLVKKEKHSHSHSHDHEQDISETEKIKLVKHGDIINEDPTDHNHSELSDHPHDHHDHSHDDDAEAMNMKAVYLHVIGDFLGSIIVMITNGLLLLLSCQFIKQGDQFNSVQDGIFSTANNYTNLWYGNLNVEETVEKTKFACDSIMNNGLFSGGYVAADCLLEYGYLQENDMDCWSIDGNGQPVHYNDNNAAFANIYRVFGCYRFNLNASSNLLGTKIIHFTEPRWTVYLDPLLTFALVLLLTCWNLPYVKQPISILLETVPNHIDKAQLEADILACKNICALRCLHLWRFDDKTILASSHILVRNFEDWPETMQQLDVIFAGVGIYSVTIQPTLFSLSNLVGVQEEAIKEDNDAIINENTKMDIYDNYMHVDRVISVDKQNSESSINVARQVSSRLSSIDSPITTRRKANEGKVCCDAQATFSESIENLREDYDSKNKISIYLSGTLQDQKKQSE